MKFKYTAESICFLNITLKCFKHVLGNESFVYFYIEQLIYVMTKKMQAFWFIKKLFIIILFKFYCSKFSKCQKY